MIARIIRWSIHNRFLVLLATVLIAAWGVHSLRQTPLDALPDLSDTQVIVKASYPADVQAGGPFDPNAKVTKMTDYRQLYLILETKEGQYYMTLVGPAKTIEKHKKGFDEWLKNFK